MISASCAKTIADGFEKRSPTEIRKKHYDSYVNGLVYSNMLRLKNAMNNAMMSGIYMVLYRIDPENVLDPSAIQWNMLKSMFPDKDMEIGSKVLCDTRDIMIKTLEKYGYETGHNPLARWEVNLNVFWQVPKITLYRLKAVVRILIFYNRWRNEYYSPGNLGYQKALTSFNKLNG